MAQSPRRAGPVRAGPGPQRGHVVDGGPGQREERLEVQPDRGGHPLDLAQQRHHVVGRDAGGGVIGGPVVVGHLDHAAAQARRPRPGPAGAPATAKVTPEPSRAAPTSPLGRGTSGCTAARSGWGARASSPSEPDRWATVVPGDGTTAAATSATASSGVAMTSRSTPAAARASSSWRPRKPANSQPARRQCSGQGRAGPTGTDDPDGVHLTSFGVPAPCGCRSPTDDRR